MQVTSYSMQLIFWQVPVYHHQAQLVDMPVIVVVLLVDVSYGCDCEGLLVVCLSL